ncbi:MAG: hypothetical protein Q9169_004516 [Polycauliona sp. 2 TL-2023]
MRELVAQRIAAVTRADDRRNGSILSRFTREDGRIGFTVRIPHTNGTGATTKDEEVEIDLANIYDFVTPEELERYEHHDIVLEDEREANRPKVGRPRKRSPGFIMSTEVMGQQIKIKKPLGRPRKRPRDSDQYNTGLAGQTHRPRSTFAGVHIPSPVKASQVSSLSSTKPTSSIASETVSRSTSQPLNEDDISTLGQGRTPESRDVAIHIDQLTPSNVRKVIGAPQPGLGPRPHRPSYSMVRAALGESETETEDDLPRSPSEDELSSVIPTVQPRRFSTNAEVAESVSSEAQDPITISSSSASPHDRDRISRVESDGRDVEMIFEAIDDNFEDHDRLLQQFQADNTRRLPSRLPASVDRPVKLSHAQQQQFSPSQSAQKQLPQYTNPKSSRRQTTPTQSRYVRKSMTPHFPSVSRSTVKTVKTQVRGGTMDESLGSPIKRKRRRDASIAPPANNNEITLGSPETSSSDGDRRIIYDIIRPRQHGHDIDAPPSNDKEEITLGTPIESSSDESSHDIEMIDEISANGPRHSEEQTTTRAETSPSRNSIASRWFGGMPWR